MPVDTVHHDYTRWAPEWKRARDVVAGPAQIRAERESYLPRLVGQARNASGNAEYQSYLDRALFYNATGRTVDGVTGMIFRNGPTITVPAAMEDQLATITGDGLDFRSLTDQILDEMFIVARGLLLVDHESRPTTDTELTTIQVESLGLRPLVAFYPAENVTLWRSGRIRGKRVPMMVVLTEQAEVAGDDEFELEFETQYRVLDILEGVYRQRLFRQRDTTGPGNTRTQGSPLGFDLVETRFPTMNGEPFTELPIRFLGPRDLGDEIQKPPILDLVYANLTHYRLMADLLHGAHLIGLPTPIITGYDGDDGEEIPLGTPFAHTFSSAEVKAFFLEFEGAGLSHLESVIQRVENHMAMLGARMLAPERRAVEAADTAAIHRHGEQSVLASIATNVSTQLTWALELVRDWQGFTGDVGVELNTDFDPRRLGAPDALALMQIWQGRGPVSERLFFDELKRGELIRKDEVFEDVIKERDAEEGTIIEDEPLPEPEEEPDDDGDEPEDDREAA